ncbi:MAG TPA: hypothetical protein VGG86_07825 [Roseiarcus sp.]|jgi:hypothetical protein
MVASFTSGRPRRFDPSSLVENQARASAWQHKGYSRPGRGGEIRIGSIAVEVEGTGAGPFFHCPECGRRARHLYLAEPISCRRCVKPPLDYASRRIDRKARYDAIRARIEREAKLALAFESLARDLERRLGSWRAKRRKGYSKLKA